MRNADIDSLKGVDNETRMRLKTIRERKSALRSTLAQKDIDDILSLREVLDNDKVTLFNEISDKNADDLQSLFGVMSKE